MIQQLHLATGAEWNPQYDVRGLVREYLGAIAEAQGAGNAQAADWLATQCREFGVTAADFAAVAGAFLGAIDLAFDGSGRPFGACLRASGYLALPEAGQAAFERSLARKCLHDAIAAGKHHTPIHLPHPRGFNPAAARDVLEKGSF